MVREVYLVYHDPGSPKGLDLIGMISEMVSRISGSRVHTVPISKVEEDNRPFTKGSLVYALFAFRGGHLATVLDRVKTSGACYLGKPHIDLIARGLSRCLRGCNRILIVYRAAKRFIDDQKEDVMGLASQLSSMTGANIRVSHSIEAGSGEDCIVVTSLMPGRLTSQAISAYGDYVRVPYLLSCIIDDIISDIVARIRRECGGSG